MLHERKLLLQTQCCPNPMLNKFYATYDIEFLLLYYSIQFVYDDKQNLFMFTNNESKYLWISIDRVSHSDMIRIYRCHMDEIFALAQNSHHRCLRHALRSRGDSTFPRQIEFGFFPGTM